MMELNTEKGEDNLCPYALLLHMDFTKWVLLLLGLAQLCITWTAIHLIAM